jgi:hypothetical protein
MQASFAVLLAVYNESQSVAFALTVAGRNHPVSGILEIIEPTICTVPSRAIIEKNSNVNQLCSAIHKSNFKSFPDEHLGIQNIRRLGPDMEQACKT